MILEEVGLPLSIPYISAFSSDGAALITLGTAASPWTVEDCISRSSVALRRGVCPGMELEFEWE
jgi:hypothetical protein